MLIFELPIENNKHPNFERRGQGSLLNVLLFCVFIVIRQGCPLGILLQSWTNLYAAVGMLTRIIDWLTVRRTTRSKVRVRVNGSHGDKKWTEFSKEKNSNKLFPSKAIARKIALSKSTCFYFEHIIDSTWANQGSKRPGASLDKPIVPIVVERRLLVNPYRISMQEGMWMLIIYLCLYLLDFTKIICRKAVTRQLVSMQEDSYWTLQKIP